MSASDVIFHNDQIKTPLIADVTVGGCDWNIVLSEHQDADPLQQFDYSSQVSSSMADRKLDIKNKMSLHAWFKKLGDPVPVEMLPKLTQTEPGRVARAIHKGDLKVHTFRATTGKVFKVVTMRDVKLFQEKLVEEKKMQKAMLTVFKRWVNS